MGSFKDFTKNIGKIAGDAALDGLAQGVRENEMRNRYTGYFDSDNTGIFGIFENINFDNNPLFDNNITNQNLEHNTSSPYMIAANDHRYKFNNTNANGLETNDEIDEDENFYSKNINDFSNHNDDIYNLKLPSWGYTDFINERNIFLRHLSNGFDIPNWLYFKIFFEFDTCFGLFGGIMNHASNLGVNCASNYLNYCRNMYKQEKIADRWFSLNSFVHLLSYINIYAPWFFKSIKNLSNISNPLISKLTEEKYIEIELEQDAIDMRITTLLSLYKYACFDDMNQKEIIPENLRKFNMCLVMFESPINNIHNIMTAWDAKFTADAETIADMAAKDLPMDNVISISKPQLKSINHVRSNSNDYNIMSYKLYKFVNCEIDPSTIGGYVPNEITNENPFSFGKNTLRIKYDRVYEYNMNEFMGLMIGSDGKYIHANVKVNEVGNKNGQKTTTFADQFIHNHISALLGNNVNYALGNIYGQDKALYTEKVNGPAIDRDNPGTTAFTEYAKQKLSLMTRDKYSILDIGFDKLYQLLGASYKSGASPGPYGDGTVLNGHGKYGIGSAVWKAKLNRQIKGGGLSTREQRLLSIHDYDNFDLMRYLRRKII